MIDKVCIILTRGAPADKILAFKHPLAGKQFVKGTVESGEALEIAAKRELFEETGFETIFPLSNIGESDQIVAGERWVFFVGDGDHLPDEWEFATLDDEGHIYRFFWHSLGDTLSDEWETKFQKAFEFIKDKL